MEQIWKSVKRDLSPRDAANLDTYRGLICDIDHDYSHQLSFAQDWIERFLSIQKL